jgi:recombinational DNA repair protein RecR
MNEIRNRHGEWAQRKTNKIRQQQSMRMLTEFLNAHSPQQKREVIKTFNPLYFVFGETLDPRKEVNHEEL